MHPKLRVMDKITKILNWQRQGQHIMLPLLLPTHSKKLEAAGTPAEAIVLPLMDYIQE